MQAIWRWLADAVAATHLGYLALVQTLVGALVLISWIGFGTRIRHHNPAPLL